jgi:hypothetical protein
MPVCSISQRDKGPDKFLEKRGVRMEWDFVLGLGLITLVAIGLVIYFGRKLSRATQDHAPENDFAMSITPSGNAHFACLVAFWIVYLVARKFEPESSLGSFLGTIDGVVAVLSGSVFFAAIAGGILKKLGLPIAKRGGSQ